MQELLLCSDYSSIHGLRHFTLAGRRKYSFRILWASVFIAFTLVLILFQLNLLFEITVKKPTIVERYYKRPASLNFPNVVICDMNQEFDQFTNVISSSFGNVTNLIMLSMQLSVNLLYETIRLGLRQNVTRVIEEFPFLSEKYSNGYSQADPSWIKTLSS